MSSCSVSYIFGFEEDEDESRWAHLSFFVLIKSSLQRKAEKTFEFFLDGSGASSLPSHDAACPASLTVCHSLCIFALP